MTAYRVTVDTDACDGIFACLVRDERFVESEDGLATLDQEAAESVSERDGMVIAEFDDDHIEQARQAADACPPRAITVEEIDTGAEDEAGGERVVSIAADTPADLLARHPETAYFWGRVVGDGTVESDAVTVRATDETAARRLAEIAGGDVDHRVNERAYAHDTSITRTEDEYTVQVFGSVGERASASLGLPRDGQPGGYRLDVFDDHRRQLLRGILEGCGTVCQKSSGTVGVSFVHDDRRLLERIQSMLADLPVDAPSDDIAETSSGGFWFGIGDDAAPTVGPWLYEGSEESGLFSPSRRRKLYRSLDTAAAVDWEEE
jgi:ferredoxin